MGNDTLLGQSGPRADHQPRPRPRKKLKSPNLSRPRTRTAADQPWPGRNDRSRETGQLNPAPLLKRAIWRETGTLDQEDWNTNQRALKFGDRLLSSYDIDAGESRLWIITEADRSSTTLCSLAITDLAPRRFLPLHPAGYADTRRDVHALLRSSPQEMHMNADPTGRPGRPPEHQPDRLHRRVRQRAPGVAQSPNPGLYRLRQRSPPVGDGSTQAQALRGPGRGRPGHHRPAAGP